MELRNPKIGIVGGTGAMGSWFADFLEERKFATLRAGEKTELSPIDIARQCDIVVISVPISKTVELIKEIGPFVKKTGLIMDLTSIKKAPLDAMLRYSEAEVVGAHPLFGPEIRSFSGQKVVLCPGRGQSGLNWLSMILEQSGMEAIVMDAEEHDRMMGLVQGVNHFSTLALALCIRDSVSSYSDILNCSTDNFKSRLNRIISITRQSSDLFMSLLMNNPAAPALIEQYLKAGEKMLDIIQKGDRRSFEAIFQSFKDFFDQKEALLS